MLVNVYIPVCRFLANSKVGVPELEFVAVMAESKLITMKLSPINGIPMNLLMKQQKVDELVNFELRSDDVFIVSYPKTGTTWMQQIVKLILANGVDDGVPPILTCPWIEADEVIREKMGQPPLDLKVSTRYVAYICNRCILAARIIFREIGMILNMKLHDNVNIS